MQGKSHFVRVSGEFELTELELAGFYCTSPEWDASSPQDRTINLQEAHTTNSTVWPVPYACAQPYHLGSGSHGQLFRPC